MMHFAALQSKDKVLELSINMRKDNEFFQKYYFQWKVIERLEFHATWNAGVP